MSRAEFAKACENFASEISFEAADSRANVISALNTTAASMLPPCCSVSGSIIAFPWPRWPPTPGTGEARIRAYIPHRDYGKVHKGFWGYSYFQYDADEDVYICPNGKKLRLKGFIRSGRQWDYQADAADCRVCTLRAQWTKSKSGRRVLRSIYQPFYTEADRIQARPRVVSLKPTLRSRARRWGELG